MRTTYRRPQAASTQFSALRMYLGAHETVYGLARIWGRQVRLTGEQPRVEPAGHRLAHKADPLPLRARRGLVAARVAITQLDRLPLLGSSAKAWRVFHAT